MFPLSDTELERLKRALVAAYAVPFIDDIEDFLWEAILAHVKGLPVPDPLSGGKSKLLFDVVDSETSIGWSAKALQWSIAPGCIFELVIQRADILKKRDSLGFADLTIAAEPELLGEAVLKHWYSKVEQDAAIQGVSDRRCAILLKSTDRKKYAYFEDRLQLYAPSDLTWGWTDDTLTGLQGLRKDDGFCVFKWYANQKQLFERFTLPEDATIFDLQPKRLSMTRCLDALEDALNSTP